jgi:porin-like protein
MLKRSLYIASSAAIILSALNTADARVARDTPGMSVNTGGSLLFNAGLVDVHTNNADKTLGVRNRKHDFNMDCTVTIKADGKTDKGLDYGAEVRLNANPRTTHTAVVKRDLQNNTTITSTTGATLDVAPGSKLGFIEKVNSGGRELVNADKAYIYIEQENYGRAELGAVDSATLNMGYYAPASFGTGGVDGFWEDWLGSAIYVTPYIARNTGKDLKVNYISPRVDGLQTAVSFTPTVGKRGRLVKRNRVALVPTGTGRLKDENFENATEWAGNYLNTFGQIGVALSAAYVHASPLKTPGFKFHDWNSWGLGGQVSYKGFTFGGSYVNNTKSGYLTEAPVGTIIRSDGNEHGHSLGLEYEAGPVVIGTNYMHGSTAGDTTIAGRDREYAVAGGLTYKIYQGFTAFGEVVGSRRDVKTGANTRAKLVQRVYLVGSKVVW